MFLVTKNLAFSYFFPFPSVSYIYIFVRVKYLESQKVLLLIRLVVAVVSALIP